MMFEDEMINNKTLEHASLIFTELKVSHSGGAPIP